MAGAVPKGRPAVFLDRDGTLIELKDYLRNLDDIVLLPGVAEGLKILRDAGYLLIVVTNQSGVARGYFDEIFIEKANCRVQSILSEHGILIDAFYYCPHHPDHGEAPYRQDCSCRKPKPGMILAAQSDYGIDLRKSWVIGDNSPDIEMADNAGLPSVLLKTGYGRALLADSPACAVAPVMVADNFYDAAQYIVTESGDEKRP